MLLPTLLRIRPAPTLSTWTDKLQLELVLGYAGCLLGYYLKTYTLGRIPELLLYLLGLLGGAATVGTEWLSLRSGTLEFTCHFSPTVCAMSAAVFVLFRYLLGMSNSASAASSGQRLSAINFGIYLCHDLFCMLLRHFGISTSPLLRRPLCPRCPCWCSSALLCWPGSCQDPGRGAVHHLRFLLKRSPEACLSPVPSSPLPAPDAAGLLWSLPPAGRRRPAQNLLLLAGSLLFYAWGEPWFVLVMMASILINYAFGLWVHTQKSRESSTACR